MNVLAASYTALNGENWPIYVHAEREAFVTHRVDRVSKGASSAAGSHCEPPDAPAPFEPNCPLGAFLNAAPAYLIEAVQRRQGVLGTVGSDLAAARRDGPIFERFSSAPTLISFRDLTATNEGDFR